jgi:hypothetical protein
MKQTRALPECSQSVLTPYSRRTNTALTMCRSAVFAAKPMGQTQTRPMGRASLPYSRSDLGSHVGSHEGTHEGTDTGTRSRPIQET